MPEFGTKLAEKNLSIEDILLDPNNPRFATMRESRPVLESHYGDTVNQQKTLSYLLETTEFDVEQLRESIRKIGYVPIDNIIVRPLGTTGKYVVVEGNRRVAAVKSLLEDLQQGYIEAMPSEREASLKHLDVKVLETSDPQQLSLDSWILQGLRHVSGAKSWGPYQQAKAVEALLTQGYTEREAASTLGMRATTVATLMRSLRGYEAMRNDAEFGPQAQDTRLFSNFNEIQKLNVLRTWLSWSDEEQRFTNTERLRDLYSWITDQENPDGSIEKRITRAIDLRLLAEIIPHDAALSAFRSGKPLNYARTLVPANEELSAGWKDIVAQAHRIVNEMPTNVFESLSDEEFASLTLLEEVLQRRIEQREALRGSVEPEAPESFATT
jgi:ParB-like chromosome segregation protein Spo0J